MRYRRFGQSDLVVSEVGFGTWTLVTDWWGRTDHPHAMITAALDAGINFIDTAPVYGTEGAGESILAPYLTVLIAAFAPLAGVIYLVTSTGWSAAERLVFAARSQPAG